MAGYRPEYTKREDMQIMEFIIKNKAYNSVKGRALWQSMSEELDTGRTWQSLKNRYLKSIVTNLHCYKIDDKERNRMLAFVKSSINCPKNTFKEQNSNTSNLEKEMDEMRAEYEKDNNNAECEKELGKHITNNKTAEPEQNASRSKKPGPLCRRCRKELTDEDFDSDEV